MGDFRVSCLNVQNPDGSIADDLRFAGAEVLPGKYALPGLPAAFDNGGECETLRVTLRDDVTGLTLDCAGLEYISSAGLRVLLKTQKALHPRGGVTLTHVNETVAEVLDITGFSDFLTIV